MAEFKFLQMGHGENVKFTVYLFVYISIQSLCSLLIRSLPSPKRPNGSLVFKDGNELRKKLGHKGTLF
jgi:hypothetical protein